MEACHVRIRTWQQANPAALLDDHHDSTRRPIRLAGSETTQLQAGAANELFV
jgi:hypothetical protein